MFKLLKIENFICNIFLQSKHKLKAVKYKTINLVDNLLVHFAKRKL